LQYLPGKDLTESNNDKEKKVAANFHSILYYISLCIARFTWSPSGQNHGHFVTMAATLRLINHLPENESDNEA